MSELERVVGFLASVIGILGFAASIYNLSLPAVAEPGFGMNSLALRLLVWLVLIAAVAACSAFWAVRCAKAGAGAPMVFAVAVVGACAWTAGFLSVSIVTGAPTTSLIEFNRQPSMFLWSAMGCMFVYVSACSYFIEAFAAEAVRMERVTGVFKDYDKPISLLKVSKDNLQQLTVGIGLALFAATYLR